MGPSHDVQKCSDCKEEVREGVENHIRAAVESLHISVTVYNVPILQYIYDIEGTKQKCALKEDKGQNG